MRISDWSSDVCSSDLPPPRPSPRPFGQRRDAMTTYTVQCGYAAYYANTVEVEAESLEAALERAIEKANDDPHWRALDHCGPTFVDAVAEGADAAPWSTFSSVLPIPDRFTEGCGAPPVTSSEERRVGKRGVSTCRSRRT